MIETISVDNKIIHFYLIYKYLGIKIDKNCEKDKVKLSYLT